MIEVTFKYVGLVMGADNDGEGGIMALISLIRQIPAGSAGAHQVPARRASACSGRRSSSATA